MRLQLTAVIIPPVIRLGEEQPMQATRECDASELESMLAELLRSALEQDLFSMGCCVNIFARPIGPTTKQ